MGYFFMKKSGVRGQVTIFVIAGLLMVVSIIALFLLMNGGDKVLSASDSRPREDVRNCVKDIVQRSSNRIIENGGEISPSTSLTYDGERWNYLCYTDDLYQPCDNLHPMLEQQIEEEILTDTATAVQGCFNEMRETYEASGFDVSGGASEYYVDILPGHIDISLKKNIEISGEAGSSVFDDFSTGVVSPAYGLIQTTRRIVNSEAESCDFEYNVYMMLYPDYYINVTDYRNNRVYKVLDRDSKTEFKFAVRSCPFPPGY